LKASGIIHFNVLFFWGGKIKELAETNQELSLGCREGTLAALLEIEAKEMSVNERGAGFLEGLTGFQFDQ